MYQDGNFLMRLLRCDMCSAGSSAHGGIVDGPADHAATIFSLVESLYPRDVHSSQTALPYSTRARPWPLHILTAGWFCHPYPGSPRALRIWRTSTRCLPSLCLSSVEALSLKPGCGMNVCMDLLYHKILPHDTCNHYIDDAAQDEIYVRST